MANILMRGLISLILLFDVIFPVDSTRGFFGEGPTCQIARPSSLESLRRLQTLLRLYELAENYLRAGKGRHGRERKTCLIINAANESTGMSGSVNWVQMIFTYITECDVSRSRSC